jgi:hypothetical protein
MEWKASVGSLEEGPETRFFEYIHALEKKPNP